MKQELLEEKLLLMLKLFAKKKASQEYSHFRTPHKIVYCMILSYKTLSWY